MSSPSLKSSVRTNPSEEQLSQQLQNDFSCSYSDTDEWLPCIWLHCPIVFKGILKNWKAKLDGKRLNWQLQKWDKES